MIEVRGTTDKQETPHHRQARDKPEVGSRRGKRRRRQWNEK
jgi:hypothetical protein